MGTKLCCLDVVLDVVAKRRRLCSSTDLTLKGCSSSSFNNLTDDLLLDILLKLSPKFLHRCKSVSKRWYSLISSPFFARSCILRSTDITIDNNLMLLFKINRTLRGIGQVYSLPLGPPSAVSASLPLTFDFIPSLCPNNYFYDRLSVCTPAGVVVSVLVDMDLKATYGSLVLLEGVFRDHTSVIQYYRNLPYFRYFVCNPVTKHWVELPSLSTPGSVGFACYYVQASGTPIWADVSSYSNIISQNPDFNPNLIDFTVVSVNFNKQANVFIIRVFSSADKTPAWTNFIVRCPPGRRWISKPDKIKVVFCNGKFHWRGKDCIAVYDPFNDPWECDVIPLPPRESLYSSKFSLETSQGHLRLVMSFRSSRFLVWELEDYDNKSWRKKFDVGFTLDDDNTRLTYGAAVGDKIYMLNQGNIMLFDLGTASRQRVCKYPFTLDTGSYWQLFEPFLSSPWPTPVPMPQRK